MSGLNGAISRVEKSTSSQKLEQLLQESQAKVAAREKARIDTILSRRAELDKPTEPTPSKAQAKNRPAPGTGIKENFTVMKPQPGPKKQPNDVNEEFAWSQMDVALSTAPAFTPTAPKATSEPTPEVNDDEDVVFSWSPIGSPEPEVAPVLAAAQRSPPPPPSRCSPPPRRSPPPLPPKNIARHNASECPSTIPDNIPIPGTPNFHPNLKNILVKKNREKANKEAEKKKAAAKSQRIEKQKAERRRQDNAKAAEKKKQQILAEADERGITITPDSLRAQVELFMEKREVSRPTCY